MACIDTYVFHEHVMHPNRRNLFIRAFVNSKLNKSKKFVL